jgi:transposase
LLEFVMNIEHYAQIDHKINLVMWVRRIEVSSGWVTDACTRVRQAVAAANAAITDAIAEAGVAHFDESVTRVNGKNHWMHTAATATLTAFHIDRHGRGVASITAFGILPRFAGVAVHDAYLRYNGFTGATHALCKAHAVRELAGIGEFDTAARDDCWTRVMIDLLAQTFLAVRGYISSVRKHGLRAADALRNALLGNPWMPPGYAAT